MTDKTTIYLSPMTKRFLQHKAIEENTSISALINAKIEEEMDEIGLLKELTDRRNEPTISFDEVLGELGLAYNDLQN